VWSLGRFWQLSQPLPHALDFRYAIAALAWVDRGGSGKVPLVSSLVVIALLLASVAMFVGLIQRIGLLQINRMLTFTGNQGRAVIETVYPGLNSPATGTRSEEFRNVSLTQTVLHHSGVK
jgi:uncharacterized membrane protein